MEALHRVANQDQTDALARDGYVVLLWRYRLRIKEGCSVPRDMAAFALEALRPYMLTQGEQDLCDWMSTWLATSSPTRGRDLN